MSSGAGSLLKIDERTRGLCIKPMENVINLYVEPGVYLILDEYTDFLSKNRFIEILYKKDVVLIKYDSNK